MTPMFQQYFEVKNQYKDYLLFYRIGDFYEMFYEDAEIGSRVLDLTLTGRDNGDEDRAPMCGIPFHAVDVYIGKLVAKGYKIAICEQMEDPALAKGLVKREVIRIVTPGTVVESNLLTETKNNYLAAVVSEPQMVGVCFADISTGVMSATHFTGDRRFDRLLNELGTYQPCEVLLSGAADEFGAAGSYLMTKLGGAVSQNQAYRFELAHCRELVENAFGNDPQTVSMLVAEAANCEDEPVVEAAGALLDYIIETQKTDPSYFTKLDVYIDGQYLEIDLNTRRNLELCETMRTKERKGTLLWVLDHTSTSMGARLLRQWIELPLVNANRIDRRLAAVDELANDFMMREETALQLKSVLDLERLTTRLVYGSANGKDLNAIKNTVAVLPEVKKLIEGARSAELAGIFAELDDLSDLHALIEDAIDEDAPFSIREGGVIRAGYSEEVDNLRAIIHDSKGVIEQLESREREATGIKNLRIGYNRVFGYYIDVTRSQLSLVPETYIRKQTLAGSGRYITQELKDTEATILGAADRINTFEYELFKKVAGVLADNITRIQSTARLLARLDVYVSLAEAAVRNNYVRPTVDYGDVIEIRDGRHPVVERFVTDNRFVPNDTLLDTRENRLMLITGPNMAGKSTYMRQVALITLMAQIGSFVPAKEARIGICDRIFTRVGASDDLAMGQSTFMLEMNEVAYILKNATKRSLIVYDEIGRGTSTFDGMAMARAIAEFTAGKKLSAKTLFATHYHELTELEDDVDGVVNYSIAAKKRGDDITFLRKIVRGAADDSYGIEVAKLAGVPIEVIRRAKEVLKQLEDGSTVPQRKSVKAEEAEPDAMTFENVLSQQVADAVRAVDLDTMSPIEALNELYRLKKMLL